MKKSHHLLVALFVAVSFWPDAARAQNLYVGSNTPSNTLDLTSDTNSYVETYIGFSAGSDGNALTVANPGTLLTNSNDLYVGNEGSGNRLTISNGGAVDNLLGRVGSAVASSNNSVLVTDTGSLWTTRVVLYIGESGSGSSLVVSNAGTVASLSSSLLGYNAASANNTALVTGAGSIWSVTNGLSSFYVGYEGSSNSLTISDGGTVESRNGRVGLGTNSVGNSVLVTGAGSLWTNSNDLFIGEAGSGNSLIISNGGTVASTDQTSIGFLAEARSNSAVVTGADSSWSVSNDGLIVGNVGSDNSLVISDGGIVSGLGGRVGFNAGSSNNIATVTGSGSLWTNVGSVFIGDQGSASTLVISNGGTVASADGAVGYAASSAGNIATVTGAGSLWTNSSDFNVGYQASGNTLVISNGGTVANTIGTLGNQATAANNTAVVTGAGSLWTNSGDLYVGKEGSGNSLTISDGGVANNVFGRVGALATSSNNSVLVTGAGSIWNSGDDLNIGDNGSGNSLVISNGGKVATGYAGFLGIDAGSTGNTAVVTGSGSLWTNSSRLTVGYNGSSNSLVISDGGTVVTPEVAWVGWGTGASGNTALVTGTGSSWLYGDLYVGESGSGNSMVISNGGSVAGTSATIGFMPEAQSNSLVVTGVGSTMSNSSRLTAGLAGAGHTMVISDGAKVWSSDGRVGFVATNSTATVTGSGSQWNASGDIRIGPSAAASNNLVVTNGGTVSSSSARINDSTSSLDNGATVTGSGSQWNITNEILVGRRGTGARLVVSNGGVVSSGSGTVGFSNSAVDSSALITGAGSLWTNSGTLTVGHRGSNSVLTVTEGGTIAAANVVIASSNGSTGTLNIGRFGTNDASGTVNAASIAFGAGVGALNFNQSNNLTVSLPISGAGTVNQLGTATTTLEGTNTYTGGTLVSGGVLRGSSTSVQGSITNNASVVFNQASDGTYAGAMSGTGTVDKIGGGTLTVTGASSYSGGTALQAGALVVNGAVSSSVVTAANGTTLAGSGSVGGIVLNLGSTVSPGNSPGTLTSLGNVVWNPGANYNWQIHDAAPGGAGQPTGWDLINVTGILDLTALSIGSEFNINLWSLSAVSPDANGNAVNFDNTQSYTWNILTASNGITGFSADKFNINTAAFNGAGGFANALGGGTISIQQSGYDLNLVFNPAGGPSPVPEPGTWAAAALLAGGAAFMRWRKRRAKDS